MSSQSTYPAATWLSADRRSRRSRVLIRSSAWRATMWTYVGACRSEAEPSASVPPPWFGIIGATPFVLIGGSRRDTGAPRPYSSRSGRRNITLPVTSVGPDGFMAGGWSGLWVRSAGSTTICGGETWPPAADGVALYSATDCPPDGTDGLRAVSLAEAWHGLLRPSSEAVPDLERNLAIAHTMAEGGGATGSGSRRHGAA